MAGNGNENGNDNGNGRLTGKQQAFVIEYLKDFNATRAAQRAGYSGEDGQLAARGSENVRKQKIRDAINQRLEERAMGEEEVAARLAMIARSSIEDVFRFTESGWKLDIPAAHEAGELYSVKRVERTQYGMRVVMEDKLRALELLGKAHGLFIDRKRLEGEVTITDKTEDERQRLLAEIESGVGKVDARTEDHVSPAGASESSSAP